MYSRKLGTELAPIAVSCTEESAEATCHSLIAPPVSEQFIKFVDRLFRSIIIDDLHGAVLNKPVDATPSLTVTAICQYADR